MWKKDSKFTPMKHKQEVKQGIHDEQMRMSFLTKIHRNRLIETIEHGSAFSITAQDRETTLYNLQDSVFPRQWRKTGNKGHITVSRSNNILQHHKKGQINILASAVILSFYCFNFIHILRWVRLHSLIKEHILNMYHLFDSVNQQTEYGKLLTQSHHGQ